MLWLAPLAIHRRALDGTGAVTPQAARTLETPVHLDRRHLVAVNHGATNGVQQTVGARTSRWGLVESLRRKKWADENVPRVLYLIDHLSRGGAAQVVVNAAISLDKGRFSPMICTTRPAPKGPLHKKLEDARIPLIELNRRSRADVSSWKELWAVLPSITILHSHESGSNLWGRIWGRLFRVPVLITQDHTAADQKPALSHLADRMLSGLSDRIIAVSEFDRLLLIKHERVSAEKVVTIYNGIEPAPFNQPLDKLEARREAGLPDAGLLIAVVARLADQKNHARLFEALDLLPEELKSRTKCLVVGSGPLEQRLKDHVHHRELNDMVSFLGERPDIPTVLKAIDILVLPSRWECLPMVLLEALAAGTPIVATSVGGIPEVLGPLDWPLVDHTNAGDLSATIMQVAQMSAADRSRIVEAGRRLVEREFTRTSSILRLQQLYGSLLKDLY